MHLMIFTMTALLTSAMTVGLGRQASAAEAGRVCDRVKPAESDANMLTIFITGNTLGQLKPCGCSGGQLGGFERRPAVMDQVSASRRLAIDTGRFIEKTDQQDLIKFEIIMQALSMLNYDTAVLSEKDYATAKNLGLDQAGQLNFITSAKNEANVPAVFKKNLKVAGVSVNFAVVAIDAAGAKTTADEIAKLEPNTIVIGVIDATDVPEIVSSYLDIAVVRAEDTDTPVVKSGKGQKPFIVTAGRKGKYIGRLDINFVGSDRQLKFEVIPVTDKLVVDKDIERLYKSYQAIVKNEDLLSKHPKFALPNGLEYVGSKSCAGSATMKNCHEYEYEKWKEKKHAIAMESLEKAGSNYDPECVVCHVVGFNYQGGFVKPEDEGKPGKADLMNVGCEACHGPGSKHLATAGKARTQQPKMKCADCHTPEQSPEFLSKESEYYNKVVHWKELKYAKPKFKIYPNIK